MPSGSHRGYSHMGGSRSGGHSFGGHSSYGSRGGSHGGFHHRGPIFFHFGGHRYVVPTQFSPVVSLFAVLMVFSIFFIFGGWLMMSSGQSTIDKAQDYYDRYQAIIEYTNDHPELIVDGTIENHYYDEDAGKWYIEYSFPTQDGGSISGDTFRVYTAADLRKPQYHEGGTIAIAVNKEPLTKYTDVDSVPMDYAAMTLEDDGYYTTAQNTRKVGSIMLWVASCVLAGSVVLNIVIVCTTKKKVATNNNTNTTGNTTTNDSTTTSSTPVDTDKYCEYCGSKLDKDATKCHLCGARVRK